MKSAIITFILAVFGCIAPATASDISTWNIKVDATVGKARLQYSTRAWVYSPGPNYKITLYAIGPYATSAQSLFPIVGRLDQIIEKEPGAAVFNAGFWGDGPFQPAGLLLLKGRAVHQFAFAKRPGGDYVLSAVLCIGTGGKIKPLKTEAFASPDASIRDECSSAVQAGPFIVDGGRNAIKAEEVNGRPATRTVLGFDANGVPTIVIFQEPVHLLPAAEFLRVPKGRGRLVTISNSRSGGGLSSDGGLGLRDVVNLDGDLGAAGFYDGKIIIGTPTTAMPSAFALKPE